jgi:hypothetical protein
MKYNPCLRRIAQLLRLLTSLRLDGSCNSCSSDSIDGSDAVIEELFISFGEHFLVSKAGEPSNAEISDQFSMSLGGNYLVYISCVCKSSFTPFLDCLKKAR